VLLAYLTFTFILVVTPGATTAVVIRTTLAGGRAAGLVAAVGAATGNTSHAAAAGLGLAVVFARWPVALTALRIGGAVYLAWLGALSLVQAMRSGNDRPGALGEEAAPTRSLAQKGNFRQGLMVNLLNPSIATFYLIVVPTFIPAGAPPWYFATLAFVHIGMAFVCHAVWATALDKLRQFFRRPVARRTLEAVTGLALLALAIDILRSR
jgi:threonine/homoserine/homoserine lactone efflux protein